MSGSDDDTKLRLSRQTLAALRICQRVRPLLRAVTGDIEAAVVTALVLDWLVRYSDLDDPAARDRQRAWLMDQFQDILADALDTRDALHRLH